MKTLEDGIIEVNEEILEVTIPEVINSKEIQGKIVSVTSTDEVGNILTIETFIPDI